MFNNYVIFININIMELIHKINNAIYQRQYDVHVIVSLIVLNPKTLYDFKIELEKYMFDSTTHNLRFQINNNLLYKGIKVISSNDLAYDEILVR